MNFHPRLEWTGPALRAAQQWSPADSELRAIERQALDAVPFGGHVGPVTPALVHGYFLQSHLALGRLHAAPGQLEVCDNDGGPL